MKKDWLEEWKETWSEMQKIPSDGSLFPEDEEIEGFSCGGFGEELLMKLSEHSETTPEK